MSEVFTGIISKNNGGFGFIKPDHDAPEMFVMPAACQAFGGIIPEMRTAVSFAVVPDAKTGRPRADNVCPAGGGGGGGGFAGHAPGGGGYAPPPIMSSFGGPPAWGGPPQPMMDPWGGAPPMAQMGGGPSGSGTMQRSNGKFGFIKQDSGEPDMFVMPAGCQAWGGQLPAEGERLSFSVVVDGKTGKPRADNVQPEHGGGGGGSQYPPPASYGPASFKGGGGGGGFGPYGGQAAPRAPAQQAWLQAPPPSYGGGGIHIQAGGKGKGGHKFDQSGGLDWTTPGPQPQHAPQSAGSGPAELLFTYEWHQHLSKPVTLELEENRIYLGLPEVEWRRKMTVHNNQGRALRLPVEFNDIEDQFPLEVKLKADGPAAHQGGGGGGGVTPAGAGEGCTGTMSKSSGKFGFIKQDSGDADMFVLPNACEAFGRQLPQEGTRMQYTVVTDEKTGKPRAENCVPAGF